MAGSSLHWVRPLACVAAAFSENNPYLFNQIIYYALSPLLVCSIICLSLLHSRRVRCKPTGFDLAIYMVLYVIILIALAPYMFFYTGGM